MKSKLKNFSLLLFVVFLFLVSMFSILALSSCTTHKTILSASNDDLTLNQDYFLNDDGNVVSDNLFNYNLVKNGGLDGAYPVSSYVVDNGTIIIYDRGIEAWDRLSLKVYLSSGSYSFTCSLNNYTKIIVCDTSENIVSDTGSNYLGSLWNFNIITSGYYYLYFYAWNSNSITFSNIMFNRGSSALPFEPYKIWYSELKYYYFDNKVASIYNYSNNNYLTSLTLKQDSYVDYTIDFTSVIESIPNYDDINFFKVVIPINLLSSEFFCNAIYPVSTVDGEFKVNYSDGTSYLVENYSLNREYHIYNGVSTNPNKFIDSISFMLHYDSLLTILFNLSPSTLYYQNGYNDGILANNSTINDLNEQVSDLQQEITDLEYSLQQANIRAQNSLDHLTYTMIGAVMSTPFNILHDYLNWNFFGINLFSLFTSLVTLLLIIWIIKFLLGRK